MSIDEIKEEMLQLLHAQDKVINDLRTKLEKAEHDRDRYKRKLDEIMFGGKRNGKGF